MLLLVPIPRAQSDSIASELSVLMSCRLHLVELEGQVLVIDEYVPDSIMRRAPSLCCAVSGLAP